MKPYYLTLFLVCFSFTSIFAQSETRTRHFTTGGLGGSGLAPSDDGTVPTDSSGKAILSYYFNSPIELTDLDFVEVNIFGDEGPKKTLKTIGSAQLHTFTETVNMNDCTLFNYIGNIELDISEFMDCDENHSVPLRITGEILYNGTSFSDVVTDLYDPSCYSDHDHAEGKLKDFKTNYLTFSCPDKNSDSDNVLDNVTVYPNPSSDYIIIEQKRSQKYTFRIVDSQNRMILNLKQPIDLQTYPLDISSFDAGIYFMQLTDELGETNTIKLFKN